MTPIKEKSSLLSLAERVEAAAGPDRKLGEEALLACGWKTRLDWNGVKWQGPHQAVDFWAGYPGDPTASLDAALSLVPSSARIIEQRELRAVAGGNAGCWARVTLFIDGLSPEYDAYAATPALALLAACLRAISGGKSE